MNKIVLKNVRPFVNGKFESPTTMNLADGKWVKEDLTDATVFDAGGALALPALFGLGLDFKEPLRDDIYDFIQNGKLAGNVRLTDNDMIVVDAYDCLVNITGKVKRPMYYEMKKNESVASLLKYAGGFTGDAYKNSVRLIRKNGKEYSVFNIGEFDMASFHVTDEDSVYVDSIIPRYDNMVELKGAVYRPGMYQVGGDVTSVRTLLEMADGIKEEAFTAHAVMHRMREDRTLEVISVDIDGILNGRVADIPLKANDVLFIPTKQNMMEEQTVTIHGEVYFPGKYKYAANQNRREY